MSEPSASGSMRAALVAPSWRDRAVREAFAIAVALMAAMAVGSILIMVVGQSPARVYATLVSRTWGDAHGASQVLFKATPLIFTGLSVALAFRAGLFNIGAEGQAIAGSMATAVIATWVPHLLPWPGAIVLALAAGAAAGGVVGAIPGALKAATGAHEVINTIMLNFIVAGVALYAGNEWFFTAGTTHTAQIPAIAELPRIGAPTSALNASLLLALGIALVAWWLVARTRIGFEWRAIGASPAAAATAGISIGRVTISAMALSGAVAGLVGSNYVLGYKHYFEDGLGRGIGFMGIAVALLGRNHPVGVVVAALLFGTLSQGGFAVSQLVPREIVEVLQAVIILAVIATAAEVRRRLREARR